MRVRTIGDDLGVFVRQQLRREFLDPFRRNVQGSGDVRFAIAFRREGLDYRDAEWKGILIQIFGIDSSIS
jgi:hypothetical protein